jgi:hypothetical protein
VGVTVRVLAETVREAVVRDHDVLLVAGHHAARPAPDVGGVRDLALVEVVTQAQAVASALPVTVTVTAAAGGVPVAVHHAASALVGAAVLAAAVLAAAIFVPADRQLTPAAARGRGTWWHGMDRPLWCAVQGILRGRLFPHDGHH